MGHIQLQALRALSLALLIGATWLSGCGTDHPDQPRAVKIESFEVSPARLSEAGDVTIRWVTARANSIRLHQGEEELNLGDAITSGSIVVGISESTTFTLTAYGARGASVTASRTVAVDGPQIGELTGPELVEADENGVAVATIAWSGVLRTTDLSLNAPGMEPIELDPEAADGSLEVSLTEATTFTLVAKNDIGEASRSVSVGVAYLPTIDRFEADRKVVGFGESTQTHWATTGAVRQELWMNGVQLDGPLGAEGSREVLLTSSSTLELRAFNELETMASATLEVEVRAPRVIDLQLTSSSLWLGETATLTWQTEGGSKLEISLDSSGEIICEELDLAKIEASSCQWQPPEVGVYTLTFTLSNSSGIAGEPLQIFAGTGPLITHFSAAPTEFTEGDEFEVRWTVHEDPSGNEASLHLSDDRGNDYAAEGSAGLLRTSIVGAGPYALQLEATTDHPSSTPSNASLLLLVHPRPLVEFTATPNHFDDSVDDEVTIAWTTSDAETVVIYRVIDGSEEEFHQAPDVEREAGSFTIVPRNDEHYRLVATNTIGGSTVRNLELTVAPLEVLVVEADPPAVTQGQPITLRWVSRMADEISIENIGTRNYLREETSAPYLDLPELGGTQVALSSACGGPVDTHGCAEISFPNGFLFPFDGIMQDRAWVFTPGYLSFGARTSTNPALPYNETFPTVGGTSETSLAPFWDSLGWDLPRYPTGNIWTALLEEDDKQVFVIQWRDVGYFRPDQRTASFNFEVVLREDGKFDFRYGVQTARDSDLNLTVPIPGTLNDYYTTAQIVGGASATIGFQLPSQSDFDVIAFNNQVPMNGSREHRTFSYRPLPAFPRAGELVFSPYGDGQTFPITVTATRDGDSHSKSVDLHLARRPILNLVPEEIAPVPLGEEFRIGWKTSNANSLVIIDEKGTTRYTAPNQNAVDEGLVGLVEEEPGNHKYTMRISGAHGFVLERQVLVQVFGAFGVASFMANGDAIEQGGDVLLSWEVFGAASVDVLADGNLLFSDPSGTRVNSYLVENVQRETEFKIIVTNEVGVTDERALTVGLWDFVFGLQTSAVSVRPGDPVTVSLDARTLDGDAPVKVYGFLPLAEVPGPDNRYSNISTHPTSTDLAVTNATSSVRDVVLPFPFPYMGVEYTEIRAFVDGYISFNTSANVHANNLPFPSSVGQAVNVHLAPFWDDLHPHSVGRMHTAQIDDDTFVIQWSKMSAAAGSISASPWDLNFQLVLHRDGIFEYRYGTMEPHPSRRPPSGCFPNTCVHEANGSAATIGYQSVFDTAGFNYHFGGSVPALVNLPIADGLSHRTVRYPVIRGAGSFTFFPQRSETYTFCANASDTLRCRDLRIEAEFGLHEATLSKEQISLGESVIVSWTSTGGQRLSILDGETVVYTTSNLAEIDHGSAVLNPTRDGAYVVELVAGNRRDAIQKLVEVDRVGITATATASTGPGAPVTLNWTLTTADPLQTPHLVAPMEAISNADYYSDYDLTTQDGVTVLIGANSDFVRAKLDFVDFSFPYFGTNHDHIQVFTDGYLGWDTVNSVGANVSIPNTTGLNHTKAIAPFWDDLHTWQSGRVLAKKIDADRYVIQWSRMSFRWGSTAAIEANLNFLVVLHRDGAFEFRFGDMLPPPTPVDAGGNSCAPMTCERESNGSSATIGYQLPGGIAGWQVHFGGGGRGLTQPIVAGGLEYRAWKFSPTSVGSGSIQVHPADSTLYKICTYDPPSNEVRCAPTLKVEVPWGIDFAKVEPSAPLTGQPVTLSWSVRNLEQLRILANGSELASYSGSGIPLLGTIQDSPTGSTTYTLEATSLGRTITKTLQVEIRAFDLTVSAPSGRFFPGETVIVDWALTNHTSQDITMLTPMSELEIGPGEENAFVDISTIPDATELTLSGPIGSVTVNLPFPFPYQRSQYERLEVFASGYLSFSANPNAWGPARHNFSLPTSVVLNDAVNMAVFWDDLILRGGDSVWRYSPDADTVIIQWKAFSRQEGSSTVDRFNLNFQAVLRRDGSFDYRYGQMEPPQQPFTYSGCQPESCVNEANGSSATIGYQFTSGAQYAGLTATGGIYGSNVHVGSLLGEFDFLIYQRAGVDGFLAFPDGLSHRSFRYTPAQSGSSRVVVGRTGDQEICAFALDFIECKTIRVEAVASAGELMITELMLDPAAGVPGQWIEVRNLSQRTIDLEGFELRSNQGSHKIAGALPVLPGDFVTLASSRQVPFTPSYVYGEGVPLNRLFDRLELLAGTAIIGSATWGADWNVPANEALSLDPSRHLTGIQDNSDFARWCNAGSSGNPGAAGDSCLDAWYAVDPLSDRAFIDISSSGSRFYEIEGQALVARLPSSGFPVKLYGTEYSRLWVSSSGWVSLSDLPVAPGQPLPPDFPRSASDPRGPLIAPFWTLLRCMDERCQVFYERRMVEEEDVLIIQWQGFTPGTSPTGDLTFQLQIWASGDLVVAFDHVASPFPQGSIHSGGFEGSTAWIGLESADPSIFTTAHDRRFLGLDRRSILFRPK